MNNSLDCIVACDNSDIPQLKALWKEAFGDSSEYIDWYFEKIFPENITFAIKSSQGEIISMLHLNPYIVYDFGKIKNIHYIVGVATKEEYKKMGYMRKVMNHSLNYLKGEGEDFTCLMPEKEVYYKGFGFSSYEKTKIYNVVAKTSILSDNISIKVIMDSDFSKNLLESYNERMTSCFDLFAIRSLKYLRLLNSQCIVEKGNAYAIFEDDEIRATFGTMVAADELFIVQYIGEKLYLEVLQDLAYQLSFNYFQIELPSQINCLYKKLHERKRDLVDMERGKGIMYKSLKSDYCTAKKSFSSRKLYINEII